MNFFVNGKLTEVYVDDYFPCNASNGKPLFTTSKDEGEIWPMLMEKAWAKLHKSYCLSRLGSASMSYPYVTGMPCVRVDHNFVQNIDLYWQCLCLAED